MDWTFSGGINPPCGKIFADEKTLDAALTAALHAEDGPERRP